MLICLVIKNLNPIETELFIRGRELNIYLSIIQSYFAVTYVYIDFINIYKKCTAKSYSFLGIDATLVSHNSYNMINVENCERWLVDFVIIILKSFKKLHMIENIENIQNKTISKEIVQRLRIAPAQVNADNASENLLNEIRQIIYSLYCKKEIIKNVYNNIIDSKNHKTKWILYL